MGFFKVNLYENELLTKYAINLKSKFPKHNLDFLTPDYIFNPCVNYSGNRVVYLRPSENDDGLYDLWLYDMKNKSNIQIMNAKTSQLLRKIFWSPNDEYIYFVEGQKVNDVITENFNIYQIDSISSEHPVKQITDNNTMDLVCGVLPNNQIIIYSNRSGKNQLYIYDQNKTEYTNISNLPEGMLWVSLRTYFPQSIWNHDNLISFGGRALYCYNIDTNLLEKVLEYPDTYIGQEGWSSDKNTIIFTLTDKLNENPKLGFYNVKNKELKMFENDDPSLEFYIMYNDTVILSKFENGKNHLEFFDMDENIIKSLKFDESVFSEWAYGNISKQIINNKLFFVKSSFEKGLTFSNYSFLTDKIEDYLHSNLQKLPKSEYIFYDSNDRRIAMFILKPKDFNPTKRYPSIIEVHAGPHIHWQSNFYPRVWVYQQNGFIVFLPNFSGSSGYGVKFENLIKYENGGMGVVDIEDIDNAIDYIQDLNYIDKNKINMTGVSWGGYLSLLHAVKGKNRKNINKYVPVASMTSLTTYIEDNHPFIYFYMAQKLLPNIFIEDKDEKEKALKIWRDCSPINYIGNIKSGIYMVQSKIDDRVPIKQGRMFVERFDEFYRHKKINFDFFYEEYNLPHDKVGFLILSKIIYFINT